jgi:hypothetical protein
VVGVEAYYDYETSVFRNGLEKVGGVFVIDSTDPLCSSGSSAAADDDAVFNDDNEGVGHRRNLMGNESEIDTTQRRLQYYQNNRRGPRATDNRRGAYPLQTGGKGGGTSTLQTGGKGGSPSTQQTGPGKGGTSTLQTGGKGGSPSTSQTGKTE